MRHVAVSTALLLFTVGVTQGADLKSGLQVGDGAGAYNVRDVTGPNAGKSLCYR